MHDLEGSRLDRTQRAEMLVRAACSSDVRRARALLRDDPGLAGHDLACALVAGDAEEVRRQLARRPQLARGPIGPLRRDAILYACFSRLLRPGRSGPSHAPRIRASVVALLEAGADPSAEFREGEWRQTALYGAAESPTMLS